MATWCCLHALGRVITNTGQMLTCLHILEPFLSTLAEFHFQEQLGLIAFIHMQSCTYSHTHNCMYLFS